MERILWLWPWRKASHKLKVLQVPVSHHWNVLIYGYFKSILEMLGLLCGAIKHMLNRQQHGGCCRCTSIFKNRCLCYWHFYTKHTHSLWVFVLFCESTMSGWELQSSDVVLLFSRPSVQVMWLNVAARDWSSERLCAVIHPWVISLHLC